MRGRELAHEAVQFLKRLQEMERFTAEDYEEFAAELIEEHREDGIPDDFFEALRETTEKRYAALKSLITII